MQKIHFSGPLQQSKHPYLGHSVKVKDHSKQYQCLIEEDTSFTGSFVQKLLPFQDPLDIMAWQIAIQQHLMTTNKINKYMAMAKCYAESRKSLTATPQKMGAHGSSLAANSETIYTHLKLPHNEVYCQVLS